MSYSIFLINNNSATFKPIIIDKYSNNDTFAISQYNITELSMNYYLEDYYHYGIKDNKNNYYEYGISYDIFDLNKMNSPSTFYEASNEFKTDSLFMASLYVLDRLCGRT